MRPLGCLLIWLLLVLPGGAAEEPVADRLQVSLEMAQSHLQERGPARIRIQVTNPAPAALAFPGAALFGRGVTLQQGDTVTLLAGAAPGGAGEILLPPGARLSATFDLAELAPAALAQPGQLVLGLPSDRFQVVPLPLEVWRDYSRVQAVITTTMGTMTFRFYPDKAPATVRNFVRLAEKHFYDGLTFHRVVKGFMIQGGCPRGDGSGDADETIPLELSDLEHTRGTLSMARKADPDSASCQFFICHADKDFLNGNYAAFGRLVDGSETLDRIASVACLMAPGGPDLVPSRPREKVVIESIRIVDAPAKGG